MSTNKEARYQPLQMNFIIDDEAYTLTFVRMDSAMHPRLDKRRRATICSLVRSGNNRLMFCEAAYLRPGEHFNVLEGQKQVMKKICKQVGASSPAAAQRLWDAWGTGAGLFKNKKKSAGKKPSAMDRRVLGALAAEKFAQLG